MSDDPAALADLLDFVFDAMAEGQAPDADKPAFEVTDAASADWVLRKLAAIAAQEAEDNAVVADLVRSATEWQRSRQQARAADVAFFEGLLREWHESRLAQDPNLRSIDLPSGTLQFRKQPDKWNRDEAAILDWLEEQGHTTFTKKALTWAEFKKEATVKDGKAYWNHTGELVPSISVVAVDDKFSAKPK